MDTSPMDQIINISPLDLALASGMVVVVIGLSMWRDLGIHKSIIVATLRCIVQLIAIGYVLGWVFSMNRWPLVTAYVLAMCLVAGYTIYSGQQKGAKAASFTGITISLFLGGMITLIVVQYVVIGIRPWYDPRYLIPIAGMIFGNALSAIALCLNHFAGALKDNADEVEQRLALGASRTQAAKRHIQNALRSALLPVINSMTIIGLVQLPGMMTGQILGGIDPVIAVKYQIVVMFMILAGNGLSTFLVMIFSLNRFFTMSHQLRREML